MFSWSSPLISVPMLTGAVAFRFASTSSASTSEKSSSCNRGVYFDVRSEGPALTLTALSGADGTPAQVSVWACEGSGAGRETARAAWRQVGAGTLNANQSTRLALSTPGAVGVGATVGLYVHARAGGKLLVKVVALLLC